MIVHGVYLPKRSFALWLSLLSKRKTWQRQQLSTHLHNLAASHLITLRTAGTAALTHNNTNHQQNNKHRLTSHWLTSDRATPHHVITIAQIRRRSRSAERAFREANGPLRNKRAALTVTVRPALIRRCCLGDTGRKVEKSTGKMALTCSSVLIKYLLFVFNLLFVVSEGF